MITFFVQASYSTAILYLVEHKNVKFKPCYTMYVSVMLKEHFKNDAPVDIRIF